MNTPDNRVFPRYAVDLEAQLLVGSESIRARTHNLSRGGFALVSPAPVPIGSECTVRMALVFSEGERSEAFEIACTIVWCTKIANGHQLGLKFAKLDEAQTQHLGLFLKFLAERQSEEEEDD